MKGMPPSIVSGFAPHDSFHGASFMEGLGFNFGPVKLDESTVIEGVRVIMRDTWIAESYTPLKEQHQPDNIYIHKNHLSEF